MSYAQLLALKNGLAAEHSDPIADEAYAELEWYLQNIPLPGESEEDIKQAEKESETGLDQAPPMDREAAVQGQADELLRAPGGEEEEGGEFRGGEEELPPEEGGEELPPGEGEEGRERIPPPPEGEEETAEERERRRVLF
jgi:hypothetical protein